LKDLNLIPKNYFIEKKNNTKKAYLSILILCIGFVVAAVYIVPSVNEYNLKIEKNSLEQQVIETSDYVTLDKEFNSLKQAIEAREQEGTLLSQKQLNQLAIVNAIEAASPEKLFIQKFDTSGEEESDVKVSLTGVAENEETIASFIRNLIDDAYFKEVGLASVIKEQGNNGSNFDIVITGVNKDDFTKYNGWDNGFSIGYLPDWNISQEKDNKIVFVADTAMAAVKPASLEVLLENTKLQVDTFTKERQQKLKKSLNNFKHEYSNKTKNSKVDAIKTMYYAEENNIKYQYLELCVIKDNKCYVVTYKSDSASFSNTARVINRILKSFKIN
jgi:Tfp pilus assembly protein PilN